MQTCNNCGHLEKDDMAVFCQNCGSSLKEQTNYNQNNYDQKRVVFARPQFTNINKYSHKKIGAGLFIGILLIGLAISGLIIALNNFNYYTKIGERTYTEPLGAVKEISLDLSNSIGDYYIKTSDSVTHSYEIYQEVYSIDGNTKLADSNEVLVSNNLGKVSITFDSNQNSLGTQKLKYNFNIYLSTNIIVTDLNLVTGTGSIDSTFLNQSINSFVESSGTGNIYASFTNCSFVSGNTKISTSTGSVQFDLYNPTFKQDRYWTISTSTGSINTNVQIENIDYNKQSFSITTSTGSVNLNRSYNNNPFEIITAKVSTGSISYNNFNQSGKTFYNNNGNSGSPLSLNFTLETSTGNIFIN